MVGWACRADLADGGHVLLHLCGIVNRRDPLQHSRAVLSNQADLQPKAFTAAIWITLRAANYNVAAARDCV